MPIESDYWISIECLVGASIPIMPSGHWYATFVWNNVNISVGAIRTLLDLNRFFDFLYVTMWPNWSTVKAKEPFQSCLLTVAPTEMLTSIYMKLFWQLSERVLVNGTETNDTTLN